MVLPGVRWWDRWPAGREPVPRDPVHLWNEHEALQAEEAGTGWNTWTTYGCRTDGGAGLVEHDGLRVLVHHLSHVPQDVLLGDDAQEAPEQRRSKGQRLKITNRFWRVQVPVLPAPGDQTLAEAQLAEDVHHGLHGRVVGDGEGAEVQDAPQLQRLRVAGRQLRRVLGEVDQRAAHHAVLLLAGRF